MIQRHLYVVYPVEVVPVDPFRLDSMPSPLDAANGDRFGDIPPISIGNDIETRRTHKPTMATRTTSKTTSRNINAFLNRAGSAPGSLNSSPVSMSMNQSAAQRLVYDRANAAAMEPESMDTEQNWIENKIRDLTSTKYTLLAIVLMNGNAYFLSLVAINLWFEFGIILRFEYGVEEVKVSYIVLLLLSLSMIYYFFCDFKWNRYFGHILSPHIYCSVCMAAMVSRHAVGDRYHEADGTDSSLVIAEIIGFCVVTLLAMWKAIKIWRMSTVHRTGLVVREQNCNIDDDYQQVVD